MSARTIALQLRTLAAEPESQALLLAEASCLSGLVSLLHADNDEDVLILSLQALSLLAAAGPHTHPALVNQPGLVVALSVLTEKLSVVIRTNANNVLSQLEGYINGGNTTAAAVGGTATPGSSRRTPITSHAGSRGNTRPGTPSGSRSANTEQSQGIGGLVSGYTPRYLHSVGFDVVSSTGASLEKSVAEQVEKALVAIKGVVSVAYATGGKNASNANGSNVFTLYTNTRPAHLSPMVSKALAEMKNLPPGMSLTASMVSNKAGAAGVGESDKENAETGSTNTGGAPTYLNKSAAGPSYLKKPAAAAAPIAGASAASSSSGPAYLSASGAASTSAAAGSRALTTHATASSSADSAQALAARYAASKKKAEAAAAAQAAAPVKKGIISSVTSYFW